ncbi:MAG: hypothetical protein ACRCX2_28165 [Paraclostridium sp.]
MTMKTGIELISEERQRQIEKGYSKEHDAERIGGHMALMAAVYAIPPAARSYQYNDTRLPKLWPIGYGTYSPNSDRIVELQKAGALIAAEIDRIQNKRTSAQTYIPE